MRHITSRRSILLASVMLGCTGLAQAQARCDGLTNPKAGAISVVGNSFPALQHIAKEMESCTKGGLRVQFKMTPEARKETEEAFASAGRSVFDAAVVSGGVYSSLLAKGQLQPMTDLVQKYRDKYKLEDSMNHPGNRGGWLV